ncbi:hypothetical protein [Bacillus sonorensis]|uniref:hypothetical protein n=1 Tax=Bacillus sonorensis TaxID=119858 RepID=UPI00228131E3|nr:hypothetical protein [Bacillus sonorensis]MCY8269638.1 hypothetical protein [Bacillus sonorensis]MCY8606594.1 hypothetical protein [Bacillus sonorensis]
MNLVFTASRIMKGSEVHEFCKQARENPALLLLTEVEAKKSLIEMKKQQAGTLTASTKDVVNSL